MQEARVFVVSHDDAVWDSIREMVEAASLRAGRFPSLQAFLDAVGSERLGCLVVDAHIGELGDQDDQGRLAAACATLPTVLITDRGDVPMAVRYVKAGARDVVQKPYRDKTLLSSIKEALAATGAPRD